jgi:ribosomal protein S18 acetylase RimI-like enzyme
MSRPAVEVVRAQLGDVDEVLALWSEGRDEVTRLGRGSVSAEQLRPRLAQALSSGQAEVLLARRDGQPAGFLILREPPLSFLTDSASLVIDQIFVSAAQRRQGVARAMLGYVAGRAEHSACDQILTSVPPWARDDHRFFARLGFAPLSVQRSVPPALLRRRLVGESTRTALDDLLSRRRSLRARARLHAGRHPGIRADLLGPVTGEQPRLA